MLVNWKLIIIKNSVTICKIIIAARFQLKEEIYTTTNYFKTHVVTFHFQIENM